MNKKAVTPELIAFEEKVYSEWKSAKLNSICIIAKQFGISQHKTNKIINKFLSSKNKFNNEAN